MEPRSHPLANVETNPYSSPQSGLEGMPAKNAGVGVWRDGELLVVHAQATLPLYCVKTGFSCARWAATTLTPTELATPPLRLAVPLTSVRRLYGVRIRESLMACGIALVALAGAAAWMVQRFTGLHIHAVAFFAAGAVFCGLAIWSHWEGQPLDCVRSQGPYFWLTGADDRFLRLLPEWNGGG